MISVPPRFIRNHPSVTKGYTIAETGKIVLQKISKRVGYDLADKSILDIGCGTRLAETLCNTDAKVGRYVGMDINKAMMNWLNKNVDQPGLEFHYLSWQSERFNPEGEEKMSKDTRLPVDEKFDLIILLSVFTHLLPEDAEAMLAIVRRYVKDDGDLFFTCFLDEKISGVFEDMVPSNPLLKAHYKESFLRDLIARMGWRVVNLEPPQQFFANSFWCKPAAAKS